MNIAIYDHSYHLVTSGGDVIAAEFGKQWEQKGNKVFFFTHKKARDFFLSRGINPSRVEAVEYIPDAFYSVLWASIVHTINGIFSAFLHKNSPTDIIFASSCMFEDLLPALIAKIRQPKANLVVGIYLFPLPPWSKSYGSNMFHRYIFWAMYHCGIILSRLFAQYIWTANDIDARRMRAQGKSALAIRGGIDLNLATNAKALPITYDALCLARFHPQKNPIDLVRIWKKVVDVLPSARLALCGAGYLEDQIRREIQHLGLEHAIHMLPPVDGQQKFNLYSSTKLFLSSSHYDTGNLALDEALACGVPAVLYDTRYQHYDKGIAPVPCFSIYTFAQTVTSLLCNEDKRKTLSLEARNFAKDYSWDIQSQKALASLL
ncbi:glycosyltransferase family 4 protein [Candidatus Woesebacteria bacterium]|nr:glycosyltransferase family 4 protein [Candidatus Woesebacteria bacterium]